MKNILSYLTELNQANTNLVKTLLSYPIGIGSALTIGPHLASIYNSTYSFGYYYRRLDYSWVGFNFD